MWSSFADPRISWRGCRAKPAAFASTVGPVSGTVIDQVINDLQEEFESAPGVTFGRVSAFAFVSRDTA